jgi:MFS family permease
LLGSATRPASFAYTADVTSKEKRTLKFARLESSFLLGTVAGPLLGGFLFLITKETPFYVFSFLAFVAAVGIYINLKSTNIQEKGNNNDNVKKISWHSKTIWPFLVFAAILSLCQSSLLQSIGFYLTDSFGDTPDLLILISMTFTLLSISTIVSQYIFTDAFPLNNFNLLLFGTILLVFSYFTMAFFPKISIYYLSIIVLGLGFGMTRPALSSALSIAQTPENQGSAAGYLGSVIPIGHMTTPFIAMPIYAVNPSYLYYFSSILCIGLILFIIFHPMIRNTESL